MPSELKIPSEAELAEMGARAERAHFAANPRFWQLAPDIARLIDSLRLLLELEKAVQGYRDARAWYGSSTPMVATAYRKLQHAHAAVAKALGADTEKEKP